MSFAFAVETITDVEPATQEAVFETLDIARHAGLEAEVNGQGMTSIEPPGLTAEAIGIDVALIVLALTFGSLVAAGLPILSALVGVAIGVTGVTAATVFIAVLVALTLLPGVLGMVKSKAFGGVVRKYEPKRDADLVIVNNGVRWARLIGRRRVIAALIVVVGLGGLGGLAIPLKDVYLAFPTDSTASTDTSARKASGLIAEAFDEVAAWAAISRVW